MAAPEGIYRPLDKFLQVFQGIRDAIFANAGADTPDNPVNPKNNLYPPYNKFLEVFEQIKLGMEIGSGGGGSGGGFDPRVNKLTATPTADETDLPDTDTQKTYDGWIGTLINKVKGLFAKLAVKANLHKTGANIEFDGNQAMADDYYSAIRFDETLFATGGEYSVRLSDIDGAPSKCLGIMVFGTKSNGGCGTIRLDDARGAAPGIRLELYQWDASIPWAPDQTWTDRAGETWEWKQLTKTLTPPSRRKIAQTLSDVKDCGAVVIYKDSTEQAFDVVDCIAREQANRNRIDGLDTAIAGLERKLADPVILTADQLNAWNDLTNEANLSAADPQPIAEDSILYYVPGGGPWFLRIGINIALLPNQDAYYFLENLPYQHRPRYETMGVLSFPGEDSGYNRPYNPVQIRADNGSLGYLPNFGQDFGVYGSTDRFYITAYGVSH